MTRLPGRVLERFGYSGASAAAARRELCPAFSLPDLFAGGHGDRRSAQIKALLDAVPPYFSQGVITRDRTAATLAFGIRLMPLDAPAAGHRARCARGCTRRRA